MTDELVGQADRDEIQRYVESVASPILRPWVFANTYQSILTGLHRHRKKQMFMMEDTPITVTKFIKLYWAKEDDIA